MSGNPTHGFDVVIELSSQRLRTFLSSLPPQQIGQSIAVGNTRLALRLRDAEIGEVTILADNRLVLELTYQSAVVGDVNLGKMVVSLPVVIGDDGGNPRRITVRFPGPATVTVGQPGALDALLASLGVGLTSGQALAVVGAALVANLQTVTLPGIPLGAALGDGACAPSIADVRVRTVPDCLFILIRLGGAGIAHTSSADASAFTTKPRDLQDSAVTISNDTLLGLATCYATQDGSPIKGARFNATPNCRRLAEPASLDLDGHTVTIDRLDICVEGHEVMVSGHVSHSGTGYSVGGPFTVPMGFSCRDGKPAIDFDPDRVKTDISISIEWWVYLVAAFLIPVIGALLGPIVALVATVVVAIGAPIASAILNGFANAGLAGIAQSLADGVNGQVVVLPDQIRRFLGNLRCSGVVLDDLRITGTFVAPTPSSLTLSVGGTITDRVDIERGGEGVFAYSIARVAQQRIVLAEPVRMQDPVVITFRIDGAAVTNSGTRTVGGVPIKFEVSDRRLTMDTPLGADVSIPVSAEATDASGFTRMASTLVDIEPTAQIYDHGGTRSGLYRFLRDLLPRGLPNLVLEPNQPDPVPDVVLRRDVGRSLVHALSSGMRLDAARLARRAHLTARGTG